MKLFVRTLGLPCIILVGCGPKPPPTGNLVGTWQSMMGVTQSQYHFYPDKRFKSRMMFGARSVDLEGTWSIDGDRLNLTPTKSESDLDPRFKGVPASTLDQPARVQMRWNNPLSVTFVVNEQPGMTLLRVTDQP